MLRLKFQPGFAKAGLAKVLRPLFLAAWMTAAYGESIARAQNASGEAESMFRHLDTNKDGKLTLGDAAGNNRRMLEHIFEMAGKPQSGSVSRAEFQQVFEKHKAGRGNAPRDRDREPAVPTRPETSRLPAVFRQLDGDNDHRISRTEFSRLNQLFDRLDSNRDGQLDAEEIQTAEGESNEQPTDNLESRRPNPPTDRPNGRNPPRANSERSSGTDRDGKAAKLDGVWRGWVVRGRGERPNEGEMEIELTITGNRITGKELGTQRAPGGIGGGTFVMTGDGTTGNLDADGTSGPQDGRHFQGVYELDGDTLRWCVSNRGRQRPAVMATDRGNYLMILRRQAQP